MNLTVSRNCISFGALITILSFAFEPFIQGLLNTAERVNFYYSQDAEINIVLDYLSISRAHF